MPPHTQHGSSLEYSASTLPSPGGNSGVTLLSCLSFIGSVPGPPFLLPSSPAHCRFFLSFIGPIASASISCSISPHPLLSAQFNNPHPQPPPPAQVPRSILLALVLGAPVNPSSPYPLSPQPPGPARPAVNILHTFTFQSISQIHPPLLPDPTPNRNRRAKRFSRPAGTLNRPHCFL